MCAIQVAARHQWRCCRDEALERSRSHTATAMTCSRENLSLAVATRTHVTDSQPQNRRQVVHWTLSVASETRLSFNFASATADQCTESELTRFAVIWLSRAYTPSCTGSPTVRLIRGRQSARAPGWCEYNPGTRGQNV